MTPREQSNQGLQLLKQAVLGYLSTRPNGATNAEVADALHLRSDHEGKQKDYLSYSILARIMHVVLKRRQYAFLRRINMPVTFDVELVDISDHFGHSAYVYVQAWRLAFKHLIIFIKIC